MSAFENILNKTTELLRKYPHEIPNDFNVKFAEHIEQCEEGSFAIFDAETPFYEDGYCVYKTNGFTVKTKTTSAFYAYIRILEHAEKKVIDLEYVDCDKERISATFGFAEFDNPHVVEKFLQAVKLFVRQITNSVSCFMVNYDPEFCRGVISQLPTIDTPVLTDDGQQYIVIKTCLNNPRITPVILGCCSLSEAYRLAKESSAQAAVDCGMWASSVKEREDHRRFELSVGRVDGSSNLIVEYWDILPLNGWHNTHLF